MSAVSAINIRTETSLLDWFSFFGDFGNESLELFNDSFSSDLDSESASLVMVIP
mgnify:FL=1